MSTTEEKCCIEQCIACLEKFIAKAKEAIALMKEIKEWECCGCTDPVDPIDPVEGELLDLDMKSDAGVDGFIPIASSLYTGNPYAIWKLFQKSAPLGELDCWVSAKMPTNSAPEYIGLTMEDKKYIVTKVEFITRATGIIVNPKEINLEYRDEAGQWHLLTEKETSLLKGANETFTINVPKEKQIAVTGVRLMIYSVYPNGANVVSAISRMRVYGEKVA